MNTTWHQSNHALTKEFTFPTFADAIAFINEVAAVATELDHHPQIVNMYTKVTLTLSTHDAGDIVTDKDWALAERIDSL